jgi:hypothetical protein
MGVRQSASAVMPPRALARAENALFALTLGALAYLWIAQATAGF